MSQREFELAAACCRWPLSPEALVAIRALAGEAVDWPCFLQVARRQQVSGLAHNALITADIAVPAAIAKELRVRAHRIARRNLERAAEAVRLQAAFEDTDIPLAILKGVAVAQLAYGTLAHKQSKDIDLYVPPRHVRAALVLLERAGYTLARPAPSLSERQWRNTMTFGKELALRHADRNLETELRWRLASNPHWLALTEPSRQMQAVQLTGAGTVRTLPHDALYAYLCVHGAGHGWSRLQWLADLNALIAREGAAEVDRLHRFADALGGGTCSGLALLLCHRLLGLQLPDDLRRTLERSLRLRVAVALALDVMRGGDVTVENPGRPIGLMARLAVLRFLLGSTLPAFVAQCRATCVGLGDTIRYPLPPALHFFYPALRLPLWLWRRISTRSAQRISATRN